MSEESLEEEKYLEEKKTMSELYACILELKF